MREIDLESWPRRNHFEFFRAFDKPQFDVATRVDVTSLVRFARGTDRSLFGTIFYVSLRAANATEALRLRFVGDRVFDVECCHGSFTFLGPEDLFNYATANFEEDLDDFLENVRRARAEVYHRKEINLDDDHRLSLIYVTSLPWLDFQALTHAFQTPGEDCVPRVAWGKVVEVPGQKERYEMALQVTGHHGLMDGLHVARYVEAFGRFSRELG
jgi:chloramphenicol O-acetyltransferase type A